MDYNIDKTRDVFKDFRDACGMIGLELTNILSEQIQTSSTAIFYGNSASPIMPNYINIEIELLARGSLELCGEMGDLIYATRSSRISSTVFKDSYTEIGITLMGANILEILNTFKSNVEEYYLKLESKRFDKELEKVLTSGYNN